MKQKLSLFHKVLIAYLVSIPVFIALVAVSIMCYLNLKTYAIYYAENTPHGENINPVAIEIVEDLYWIGFPKTGQYVADFDGVNSIYIVDKFDKEKNIGFFFF